MAFLKDEEKEIILEHYFDIEWCDDVSDLRCVRCHRVAIHPYVSNCQHIFCKMCRKFYSDEDKRLNCPRCQEQITQLDEENFDVEVKIHQLKIFCPNKKYGCLYADQLRNLPSHLMVCVNTRNAAALQVEAPATNTMADVVNLLTNLNSTIGELKEEIREVKNKVDQLEKKSDNIGTKADVQLAFKNYTAEFQSMKSLLESLNQRNESLEHQKRSLKEDEMETTMDSMSSDDEILQNNELEKPIPQKAETYEWTIKDVGENILNDNSIYESEVFKFTGCKYDIKARIDHNNGWLDIGLQFKDGDMINRFHNDRVFTVVTYIVRDQSNHPKKKDILYKDYLQFDNGHGVMKWILKDHLPEKILSPPYMKDDCIKITILFEPPSFDRDFISNNGVLQWRVDNYENRKKELKGGIWSPPFYTSPEGYRVRILLYVNHPHSISVIVYFTAGEHDATLSSDFFYNTTVTLINQANPSKNLVSKRECEDAGRSPIELISIKSIEKSGYIKDNSLLFEVVIEFLATDTSRDDL